MDASARMLRRANAAGVSPTGSRAAGRLPGRPLAGTGAVSRSTAGSPPLEVQVFRGRLVESRHRVHAVVADRSGRVVASWGDWRLVTVVRSAAKPVQALPLVADGAADHFALSEEEIALCCGSHNSEEAHVEAARSILTKAGVAEERLVCGAHPPILARRRDALVAAGTPPTPVMSNCSGKHAGMLALAAFHGWRLRGYERADHPVQRRIGREVARWTSMEPGTLAWVTDGCGVPTCGVPLANLAGAAARLAAAAGSGGAPRRIVRAMTRHPFMVAGTGRLCTRLMAETGGRVFAKAGAEAVYLAGEVERRLGVALKVEGGARRAAEPALLWVLRRTGLLPPPVKGELGEFAEPVVRNTLGDEVGRVRVEEIPCS